jgi:SAM-dependent methyltransferase
MNSSNQFSINHLEDSEFIRQRLSPAPGDEPYLHLSDLVYALKPSLSTLKGSILDLGCGGSPYRSLYTGDVYHRADVDSDLGGLDFKIGCDGRVDAPSQFYDAVLSTQVLEHVPDYSVYLNEAFRVLKPGGKLLISTHGSFFDHGCPYDFHRWTAEGLRVDLENSGYRVENIQKLTLGVRAVFFLAENHFAGLWGSRASLNGWGLWFFQKLFWMNRAKRHQWIDNNFPRLRMTDSSNLEPLYICILATATKPI